MADDNRPADADEVAGKDKAPPQPPPAVSRLAFAALGVVFGDIGTNPLYAIRLIFHDAPDFAHDATAITGVLSLIIWSVILMVCVKYVTFVMRADHDGEGGTLALLGLLHTRDKPSRYGAPAALTLLVLFGSGLLYGDGMVTPAISVLSAVEGLGVATSAFKPYIVPLAAVILLALFLVQSRGTETIGRAFGPIMLVWFVTIGVLGAVSIVQRPAVLLAFDPRLGLQFLFGHGAAGYATLGSVVLAFSGVEALFADLGHFGRRAITLAWYIVVLPGLMLNYLGQGALVLGNPNAGAEPFYGLVPHWAVLPVVGLSTLATIIASQALISGVFSLTRQAINMGLAPRYAIEHTSEAERGQVYMPLVNVLLAIGCLAIVLGFRSSDALGSAYGLAVIGTMIITSFLFYLVIRRIWGWSRLISMPLVGLFFVIEPAFLGANLAKIVTGAWVPLAIGLAVFAMLAIWTVGRAKEAKALRNWSMSIDDFRLVMSDWPARDQGTGVFMTHDLDRVPIVGRHEWMRAHIAHETVLLLKVVTSRGPYVAAKDRFQFEDLGDGLARVTLWFGFMERPRVNEVMSDAFPELWKTVAIYLAQPLMTHRGPLVPRLMQRIFVFLGRSALSPVEYFELPPHLVISVGLELEV